MAQNDEDIIVKLLCEKIPSLEFLYLFGSRADETATDQSDYDLAFHGKVKIHDLERINIQNELANELGNDVDLVDLRSATDVLKVQVVDGGRILFFKDPTLVSHFEMYAYSDYARLNDSRAAILENFYGKKVIDV